MSAKRQATTVLNHENWDQDDPNAQEDKGTFKTASKEALEKRVIRTAKRRSHVSAADEGRRNVFSGFGGFNKTQPASFDFLSQLTNGNKLNNEAPNTKSESVVPNSSFNLKTVSSNQTSSIFSTLESNSNITPKKSLFGSSLSNTVTQQTLFTSKPVGESPFKIQNASTPIQNSNNPNTVNPISENVKTTQIQSANVFGSPTTVNSSKTLAPTNISTNLFQNQLAKPATTTNQNVCATTENEDLHNSVHDEEKKLTYCSKLKGLNLSVSAWIKKNVDDNPLCILTPIFKDYEKYFKEIQEEFDCNNIPTKTSNPENTSSDKIKNLPCNNLQTSLSDFKPQNSVTTIQKTSISTNNILNTPSTSAGLLFGIKTTAPNSTSNTLTPSGGFSFGIKTTTDNGTTNAPATIETKAFSNSTAHLTKTTGFSFDTKTSNTGTSLGISTTSSGFSFGIVTNSSPKSLTSNCTTVNTNNINNNNGTSFSFGTGKPFSFSSNIQQPNTATDEQEEKDDEPPKVEFTPILEENSVFDKRCKIFVKKDGNFVDKGVGTLYVKKIEDNQKYQLLVRANTNLGTILLNFILSSTIPIQRMGKNNVMVICIPTPDAKPPPISVLIRVKTSEEADELLETLNKYKG